MGLMIKTQRDGTLRPFWYGVYKTTQGKRIVVNLSLRIHGSPPSSGSLRDRGDDAFEASRKDARRKLAGWQQEAQQKGQATHLVERLIETKTGRAVAYVQIADLADRWVATRTRTRSAAWLSGIRAACRRFVEFMAQRRPEAVYLYEVTPEDATAFFQSLAAVLSPSSAHTYAGVVRSAVRRFLPQGASNPFEDVELSGRSEQVHRKPFTAAELRALMDASREDTFLYPLIVTAACTGMRRGDVCGLRWADVDLPGGMITAKTSKTDEGVEVPIFPPLREVLEPRQGNGSSYVFPEACDMLRRNPDGLTWRFKKLLAKTFGPKAGGSVEPTVDPAEMADEGADAIRAKVPEGSRRERMLDSFRRYGEGQSFRDIQAETGRLRSTISADLHAVESWTGKRFLRTRGPDVKAVIADVTRVERAHGENAASVRDWHALRVTFCTIALSAGVPVELVKRITGHKTTEIVMRHYFRPGREEFRAALGDKMPDVITGGAEVGMRKPEVGSTTTKGTESAKDAKLGGEGVAKAQGPQSELVVLAGKVAAGTATKAEKARLRKLAAEA